MAQEALNLQPLENIIKEAKEQRSGLIPTLQRAQNEYGYLPPEVLMTIAENLLIPPSQVYGVATFYTQFHLKPRGRYIIQQCDGTACHVGGARGIIASVEEKLGIKAGETTEDLKFTYEQVYCLGCCAIGPAAIINGEVFGHLTEKRVLQILDELE